MSACFEIHILPKMTNITAEDRILIKNLRIEKQKKSFTSKGGHIEHVF